MNRRTDNHKRIHIVAAIVMSIMMFTMICPVDTYAFDVQTRHQALNTRANTAGHSEKEGTGKSQTTAKYPQILSDAYWHSDGKKADFRLDGNSRFYIVIEETDKTEADETESGSSDVHVGKVSARLLETVELMASQYAEHGIPGSKPMMVFYGDEKYALPGDILIKMIPREDSQSYSLDISDGALITSTSEDGIYYGLITLMEILMRADHYEDGQAYEGSYSGDGYLQSEYASSSESESSGEDSGSEASAKTIELKSFSAEDGPDLEERAIFLDCGRKYFTPDWIKSLIRRSSLQRYNTLILHFSEASALRLESRAFPWMTEDIDHLTMDEMADIVRFAQKYHMKVVPSFDVPGHNRYIVEKYSTYVSEHPEFTFEYNGKTYGPAEAASEGSDETVGDAPAADDFASIANHYTHNGVTQESDWIGIDITKEHAVAFLDAMIDDYAEFFRELGCTDFDISGDEVLGYMSYYIGGDLLSHENRWDFVEHWADYAQGVMKIPGGSASDTFIHYLNRTAIRLMNMGYTCRVFNDEIDVNENQHLKLLSQIELSYWNAGRRSAQHFARTGHKLYNCISRWCYFASGRAEGTDMMYGKYYSVNGPNIYDNWDPYIFSSTTYTEKPVPEEACAGGYFCIWCDEPDYRSEEDIFLETEMRTWANSARMWDARHLKGATFSGSEYSSEESGGEAGEAFGYYDFEAFAGLVRGVHNYSEFSDEDHQINCSGKPLSGETWYKLTKGLLDWQKESANNQN